MDGPVRWGFLGAGGIATTALAPAVHAADGAVLQAAAARDPDRAAALRPAGAAYGSYQEVIEDPDVDAVYISLANDAHVPWTLRAVTAGKPVLCEKPLGVSAAEVDEVAAAVDAHDGLVVEALWYRWHPRTRAVERLVRDGAVGAVRHVAGGFVFAGVAEDNYRLDPAKGGGALYDVGVYPVSAVLWAHGGAPLDVAATQRLSDTGVDLTTELVLSFPDGATAEVRASIDEPDRQWLTVTGDRGELELTGQAYTSWHADSELLVSDGSGTERTAFPAADPYRLMVEEVSAAIRGGDGWTLPLTFSRAVAAVLDAAFASARAGGEPVPL